MVHTSPDCQIPSSFNSTEVSSNLINNVCTSSGQDNRGCGFSDPDPSSYGSKFNLGDGGVFAHLWDSTGIKVWRFSRDAIPSDIQAKQPNPYSWGVPVALFQNSSNCDTSLHFFNHSLVLDTTICGDFAGPTYQSAGCPGTCQQAVANATNFLCEPQFYTRNIVDGLTLYSCEMENQLHCSIRHLETAQI